MLALVIAEGVVLFLLALLVAGLLRSHAEILRALHDLGADVDPDASGRPARTPPRRAMATSSGEAAHDIAGTNPRGEAVAIAVAGSADDTLLAFLSTGCDTCQPFWSAFRTGVDIPGVRIVVVVTDEESEAELRRLAGPNVDLVASTAAWTAYEVPGSPHFVYVDGPARRIVGEGTGPDWPSVQRLLVQANADRATRTAATHGQAMPQDVEWRDSPTRIDGELLAAGIGPGHPSLVSPPDTETG